MIRRRVRIWEGAGTYSAGPLRVDSWSRSAEPRLLDGDGTHYGFVRDGEWILETNRGAYRLAAGMYFSVVGRAELRGRGHGFVAARTDVEGFFQIGGPIEETGRLRYIDGCSDSVLIAPVILGHPCLNLLHIPPGTRQTAHTHPSLRAGIVAGGFGVCHTDQGALALQPGVVFVIEPDGEHSFHTDREALLVVAWHPDSDCGPAHDNHPMLNRTLINGKSAAHRGGGTPSGDEP